MIFIFSSFPFQKSLFVVSSTFPLTHHVRSCRNHFLLTPKGFYAGITNNVTTLCILIFKMGGSAPFIVGNTYTKIPADEAVYSARLGIKKQHDVTIYVDILDNPDLIERVTFDLLCIFTPPKFVHSYIPVPVKRPNGAQAWRFATRQSVHRQFSVGIMIRGSGGTTRLLAHFVSFWPESRQRAVERFYEPRHERPFRMAALSDDAQFGIELEMSSPSYNFEYQIAQNLEATNDLQIDVIET